MPRIVVHFANRGAQHFPSDIVERSVAGSNCPIDWQSRSGSTRGSADSTDGCRWFLKRLQSAKVPMVCQGFGFEHDPKRQPIGCLQNGQLDD